MVAREQGFVKAGAAQAWNRSAWQPLGSYMEESDA